MSMLHRERESVPDEGTNKGKSGITGSSGVKQPVSFVLLSFLGGVFVICARLTEE